VSPKAHIITEKHIKYDLKYLQKKLGTTGQGIAACYADKMIRSGTLAKDKINKKFLWNGELSGRILCEGAQSFWLDINQGNYPYVTSSETLPYAACSLGFSPLKIRNIIGIAKIYDTKSGVDPLFPKYLLKNNQLNTIAELGEEFGTTTGRRRIVNWLNLNKLIESISISGTNQVIINKCDILENANIFKLYFNKNILKFKNIKQIKNFINSKINSHLGSKIKIIYSGDRSLI
jgi:adenylosuccinate synthase